MRYDEKESILYIDCAEFVAIARRRVAATQSPDGEEMAKRADRALRSRLLFECKTEKLTLKTNLMGINTELYGEPDAIVGEEIILVRELSRSGAAERSLEKQLRGELFIYGHMLSRMRTLDAVTLTLYLFDSKTGDVRKKSEEATTDSLLRFFKKCIDTVSHFARPEYERVTERHATMRALKFPYGRVRDGQGELVRAVYRNLARGNTLFACAPTGTGKTVSVIYPAIRAMGDGRIEKTFYLTPKTTARESAIECINLLCEGGLKIKAVSLIAKEKICRHGLLCREDPRKCPENSGEALSDAVMALYGMDIPVITDREILATAEKYRVCSYELSLAYSELCDFIICDLNYVFDPAVYLRRFFDEGGKYGLLIDEAHNLESRAREMYSAEVRASELAELSESIHLPSALSDAIGSYTEAIYTLLFPYIKDNTRVEGGREVGMTHLSDIPSDMYTIIYNFEELLNRELLRSYSYKGEDKATRVAIIKKLYYDTVKLSQILERFDEGYKLILSLEGGRISFKLFCIDTGRVLRDRLRKVASAVFFSATLEPMSFYISQLGGDSTSDTISVHSPFDPESLSVTIMDKISTRYSERERTLPHVCRVIAAAMSARRGHYMVFSPSFEYSEMLFREFSTKYPKIKAILQSRDMTSSEKDKYISLFRESTESYLVGFSVMGGIYSEGIDLAGDSLIGAVVVGIGMPSLSYEREAIAEYYEDKLERGKEYAYIYPGMNRVFQAAGRVIRREDDKGVIVLIDDRFDDPIYKKSIPDLWRGMRYCDDPKTLKEILDAFWAK